MQFSFALSRWLLPKHPSQVPQPTLSFNRHQLTYWLPSTTTGCHTNTASAPLSAYHEALVKTLPIQADLSWSSPPLTPLCTAAFLFFFSSYCILLPVFVWTVTCRYLALKTHSLWACLSLYPSSNRILSFQSRLAFVFSSTNSRYFVQICFFLVCRVAI